MNLENIPKTVSIHTLLDTLDTHHTDARTKFLRAFTNVLTGRCIGVSQRILAQQRKGTPEVKDEPKTLDQRNEMDHFIETADEEARRRDDMGFAPQVDLTALLTTMVNARDYFAGECVTAADNRFDYPMTFPASIDWMSTRGTTTSEGAVKAVAQATGMTEDDVRKLANGAQRKRNDQLKMDRDAILDLIKNRSSKEGSKDAFDELDPVLRHRVITSAAKAYQRSVDRLATDVITGRSQELTTLAVLNNSKPAIVAFVDEFETRYKNELLEAADRVTFDDIRQVLNQPKVKAQAKAA